MNADKNCCSPTTESLFCVCRVLTEKKNYIYGLLSLCSHTESTSCWLPSSLCAPYKMPKKMKTFTHTHTLKTAWKKQNTETKTKSTLEIRERERERESAHISLILCDLMKSVQSLITLLEDDSMKISFHNPQIRLTIFFILLSFDEKKMPFFSAGPESNTEKYGFVLIDASVRASSK